MSKEAMKEGIELILFYEQRGADWTMALSYHLNKALFGDNFGRVDKQFKMHLAAQRKTAKLVAKREEETNETEEKSTTILR